jgi:hypothetical protein
LIPLVAKTVPSIIHTTKPLVLLRLTFYAEPAVNEKGKTVNVLPF